MENQCHHSIQMNADALWCSELRKTRKAKRAKNWLLHLGNTNKTMSVICVGLCTFIFLQRPRRKWITQKCNEQDNLVSKETEKGHHRYLVVERRWRYEQSPKKLVQSYSKTCFLIYDYRFDTSFAGYHQQQIKLVRHSTTYILYSIRCPRVGTRTKRVCFFYYIL